MYRSYDVHLFTWLEKSIL